jgi:hypothetical protein
MRVEIFRDCAALGVGVGVGEGMGVAVGVGVGVGVGMGDGVGEGVGVGIGVGVGVGVGVGGTGESSFLILPVPSASETVASTGSLRWTAKFSITSKSVSPLTRTVTCFVVSAGRNVSVPEAAVKSDGAVALPSTVA